MGNYKSYVCFLNCKCNLRKHEIQSRFTALSFETNNWILCFQYFYIQNYKQMLLSRPIIILLFHWLQSHKSNLFMDIKFGYELTPCIENRKPTLRQSLLSRSRLVGINSNPGWIRRKIHCRLLWINRQFRTVRDVELNSEFPHTKYQPCAMEDPGENKVCIKWKIISLNSLT